MRIEQPPAPNSRPKTTNPLALAIYDFEQKAKKFHDKQALNAPENETPEARKARENRREVDFAHLKSERTRIRQFATIQAELELYKKTNQALSETDAGIDTLMGEAHHPTDDLNTHLAAIAEPKPSIRHDAHHIVMGKGKYQQAQMMDARLALHLHGIGINDPRNGVWLPREYKDKGHWATPGAPAHKEIHRYNYETWIIGKFAVPEISKRVLIDRLRECKTMLKYGGYPPEIVMPKDTEWTGG